MTRPHPAAARRRWYSTIAGVTSPSGVACPDHIGGMTIRFLNVRPCRDNGESKSGMRSSPGTQEVEAGSVAGANSRCRAPAAVVRAALLRGLFLRRGGLLGRSALRTALCHGNLRLVEHWGARESVQRRARRSKADGSGLRPERLRAQGSGTGGEPVRRRARRRAATRSWRRESRARRRQSEGRSRRSAASRRPRSMGARW